MRVEPRDRHSGAARLPAEITFMLGHLPQEAYPAAAAYVREVAAGIGVSL